MLEGRKDGYGRKTERKEGRQILSGGRKEASKILTEGGRRGVKREKQGEGWMKEGGKKQWTE